MCKIKSQETFPINGVPDLPKKSYSQKTAFYFIFSNFRQILIPDLINIIRHGHRVRCHVQRRLVNKQDPDQVRRDQRRGAQTHRSKRMQELLQAPLHEHRRLQRVHAEEGAVQKVDAPLLGHHRQAQAERYQITVWPKLLMIK